ncbi:MAG: hypothetical protein M1819_000911 [Sarea resinae]|nr:MAG: hypothetical protein M1819_000911 [Sarea resinae]
MARQVNVSYCAVSPYSTITQGSGSRTAIPATQYTVPARPRTFAGGANGANNANERDRAKSIYQTSKKSPSSRYISTSKTAHSTTTTPIEHPTSQSVIAVIQTLEPESPRSEKKPPLDCGGRPDLHQQGRSGGIFKALSLPSHHRPPSGTPTQPQHLPEPDPLRLNAFPAPPSTSIIAPYPAP